MDDEHHDGQELPAVDPQGRPYVGKARVTQTTRRRLVSRTCAWCGESVPYSGKGRPAKYCSKAHRNRAWEVRTARQRQERDRQAGQARTEEEPVREVIQEVITRTATRTARVEVPVAGRVERVEVERPADLEMPWEVCAVLGGVEVAVREGRFPEQGLDRVLFSAGALIRAIEERKRRGQ